MPQLIDLFCHTIFFAKLNMFSICLNMFEYEQNLVCTSLQMLKEHIPPPPPMISRCRKGIVSPNKVWSGFFLKDFHDRWKKNIEGPVLNGDFWSDYSKCRGVKQTHLFNNHFSFSNHEGTLEDKALVKIMDVFILELNS